MTGQVIHRGNTRSRSISDKWLQKEPSPATKRQNNYAEVIQHFQTEVGLCIFIEPVALALFTANQVLPDVYIYLTSLLHPSKGADLTFL